MNPNRKNPAMKVATGLVAGALLLVACGSQAANITISMSSFQFSPKTQTVSVGDTVTWVNRDFAQHDTTSGVAGVPNGIWHSPLLNNGGTFSFTFNVAPGNYPYYCTPHVFTFNMVGTITVVAPNQPPTVAINSPQSGASFTVGTAIPIQATAADSDGSITRVDFFANGTLVASVPGSGPTFNTSFNNAAAGNYSLTAIAFDNAGASTTSTPVPISVVPGNAAPSVSITNPVNGASFFVGSNVVVQAAANDVDGRVTEVRFELNGTQVASVATAPYDLVLSNLAVGNYTLGATAVDDQGAVGTAAPVQFSVVIPTSSPQIQTPPQSQSVPVGSNVVFTVIANGTEPLSYQWRFNTADIPGATGTALSLFNVQLTNSGFYSVFVSNFLGSVVSTSAFLEVIAPSNVPPTVTVSSPTNGSVFPLNSVIPLVALPNDTDGSVTQVVFSVRPGLALSNVFQVTTTAPFEATLSNLAAGIYFVAAQATDDRGGTGVSAEVSFTAFTPEQIRPTLTITNAPRNFSRQSTPGVTLGGTASDTQLFKVQYTLNEGPLQDAQGREQWLIETNLVPGMNTIRVRSVDLAGNFSVESSRFVTYVVTTSIVTTALGNGTISPDFRSQILEMGKVYKAKAQPGQGSIFVGWQGTGLVDTNNPMLSFQLVPGLTNLVAVFTNSPFVDAAGNYSGLFFDSSLVSADTSGFMNLRLDQSGGFSGKVLMNGASYGLRGKFAATGDAQLPLIRHTLTPMVLSLKLDGIQGRILGFVTNAVGANVVASDLRLERNPFSARTNASPYGGVYGFQLQQTNSSAAGVVANGTVGAGLNGDANTTGKLTAGSAFTFHSATSQSGESPFYLFTRSDGRALFGWFELRGQGQIGGQFYSVQTGTNAPVLLEAVPGP